MPNKKNSIATRLQQWIIKQSEKTDEIYKFSSSADLPDLGELKMAHFRLLREYSFVLTRVNQLSFFVNSYEYEKSTLEPSLNRFIFYLSSPFDSFPAIRPFLLVLIESHLKGKLKELENIYIKTKSQVPFYLVNQKEYLAWLSSASAECKEFSSTLSTLDNIKNSFLSFLSLLTITGGLTAITKALLLPSTIAWLVVLFIFFSVFLFLFIDKNFDVKRTIFEGLKRNSNIYQIENSLFDLLKSEKKTEWAIDYIGSGLLFFSCLIVLNLTLKIENLLIYFLLILIYVITTNYFIQKRNKSRMV